MNKQRLDELKGLIGKEVKGIAYPTLIGSDVLDEDNEGFDLIFTDNTRLEVYDLGKDGLGWCISDKEGTPLRSERR